MESTRLEAKPPSSMSMLLLILWKNYREQSRHKVQTLLEIIIPLLTTGLILFLRHHLAPSMQDLEVYPILKSPFVPEFNIMSGMDLSNFSVAYSPKNVLLRNIVEAVTAKFIARVGPSMPLKIEEYANSKALLNVYKSFERTRQVIVGIEFPDYLRGVPKLPKQMEFSLRFPERPRSYVFYGKGSVSWNTKDIFPVLQFPGPRHPFSATAGDEPDYYAEFFLMMQYLVSNELISVMTNKTVGDFEVNMRRLPSQPWILDYSQNSMKLLLPMLLSLSFSLSAINLTRALTMEKENQIKEYMKIVGLYPRINYLAWFCTKIIYLTLSTLLVVALLKIKWFKNEENMAYAIMPATNWSVLFLYLMLYMVCMICFCFVLSVFFAYASTAVLFTGIIWFLTYIPYFLFSVRATMPIWLQTVTCLLINTCFGQGLQILILKEGVGGIQWGDFLQSYEQDLSRLLFGHVVSLMIFQSVMYILLTFYLEKVLPQPYGTPEPWHYPITSTKWFKRKKAKEGSLPLVSVDTSTQRLSNEAREHSETSKKVVTDEEPSHLPIGVKIQHLTKKFGDHVAVNDLTLNVYEGQITVLLGHNGAGKSTTMAMITGFTQPTSGNIIVAGYDVNEQLQLARSHLGYCPQNNVLFEELTVREHLKFYSKMKGFAGPQLDSEIDIMIAKLELTQKADSAAASLSGGQKRRLQVGIALIGNAQVVLLDEPTSGMDPASRRALWDLLQKEKKNRSIILTTHFLDEADILGDRIAIVRDGRLICVGTPFFLKQHYRAGYILTVEKDEGFQFELCTKIISKYVTECTVKEDNVSEVTYKLPSEFSNVFEQLLNDLEANQRDIKYLDYGLSASTLEDVFLKVGSDLPTQNVDNVKTTSTVDLDQKKTKPTPEKITLTNVNEETNRVAGTKLLQQHILSIMLKLWLVWSRSRTTIVLQTAVPLVILTSVLIVVQMVNSVLDTITKRELSLAVGYKNTETLLHCNNTTGQSLGALVCMEYFKLFQSPKKESWYSWGPTMKINVINMSMFDYYMLRTENIIKASSLRYSLLIGASLEDNSATAWFTGFSYHDIAVSLATLQNALLKCFNPNANLKIYNHPLPAFYMDQDNIEFVKRYETLFLIFGIGITLGIMSAVFIIFFVKENTCKAKLLQKASGIKPITMWLSTAVFDSLWFQLICIPILLLFVLFKVRGLSEIPEELGRVILCLLTYGFALLPLTYFASCLFEKATEAFGIMCFMNLALGMMCSEAVGALESFESEGAHTCAEWIDRLLIFFPFYAIINSFRLLNGIGLKKWGCLKSCSQLLLVMPNLTECNMQVMCRLQPATCCGCDDVLVWQKPGILRYICAMLFIGFVMWAVLLISEHKLLPKLFKKRSPPILRKEMLDTDVWNEKMKVDAVIKSGLLHKNVLVINELTKYYKRHLAVNQISFDVARGDCFGLLGINGAGKTTTFKMLVGDETISLGDAYVCGHSVKKSITQAYKNIGYCPQFDALFNELTGRETLRFFCILRGLRKDTTVQNIAILAELLDFTKHLDKRVGKYSGGNKRKLSTAIALIGNIHLVFVDEPTTGVDAAAKRQVWSAIQEAQRSGRGVVLTSHSMEECEALCTRLAIMVAGQFKCIGTPQHLKNKFTQGYTLTVKLKMVEDSNVNNERLAELKRFISSNFTHNKIMEEYQGLIKYYLTEVSFSWSKIFGIMEKDKEELQIEDYSISQTTLEQIFLQFTKYSK